MIERRHILLALDKDGPISQLVCALQAEPFHLHFVEKDGLKVLEAIHKHKPDLMIMDPCMKQLDAIGVMKKLKEMAQEKPYVFILSYYESPQIQKAFAQNGADYFIARPFDVETTSLIIRDFLGMDADAKARSPQPTAFLSEDDISPFLHSLRIPPFLNGHAYLISAIKLIQKHPEYIHSVTKTVYPTLAKKEKKTATTIERSIRYAIDIGWKKQGKNRGYWSQWDHKPTNTEFISAATQSFCKKTYSMV